MHRIGVGLAVVTSLVALGVVTAAWLRTPSPITAEDAAALTAGALAEAGLGDAVVGGDPSPGVYEPASGEDPVRVWRTVATVDGGTIILWLAQDGGDAVFLDDRGPSGATQLLSEAQFRVLADREANPARDRLRRENILLTVAAAAVLVGAGALVAVGTPLAANRARRRG